MSGRIRLVSVVAALITASALTWAALPAADSLDSLQEALMDLMTLARQRYPALERLLAYTSLSTTTTTTTSSTTTTSTSQAPKTTTSTTTTTTVDPVVIELVSLAYDDGGYEECRMIAEKEGMYAVQFITPALPFNLTSAAINIPPTIIGSIGEFTLHVLAGDGQLNSPKNTLTSVRITPQERDWLNVSFTNVTVETTNFFLGVNRRFISDVCVGADATKPNGRTWLLADDHWSNIHEHAAGNYSYHANLGIRATGHGGEYTMQYLLTEGEPVVSSTERIYRDSSGGIVYGILATASTTTTLQPATTTTTLMPPACTNKKQDRGETGVDCGGHCSDYCMLLPLNRSSSASFKGVQLSLDDVTYTDDGLTYEVVASGAVTEEVLVGQGRSAYFEDVVLSTESDDARRLTVKARVNTAFLPPPDVGVYLLVGGACNQGGGAFCRRTYNGYTIFMQDRTDQRYLITLPDGTDVRLNVEGAMSSPDRELGVKTVKQYLPQGYSVIHVWMIPNA